MLTINHLSEEKKSNTYYKKPEYDCDICKHSYLYNGDHEGCRRQDLELKCLFEEEDKSNFC